MMSARRRHACGYQFACTGAVFFYGHEIGAQNSVHVADNEWLDLSPGARAA
jgi:hypothetical protein